MQWLFGHDVLMVGSLGVGKTLLARAMQSIQPDKSIEESLERFSDYRSDTVCNVETSVVEDGQRLMGTAMTQLNLSARLLLHPEAGAAHRRPGRE